MGGKLQFNAEKEKDALEKLKKGNSYMLNAYGKLSRASSNAPLQFKISVSGYSGVADSIYGDIKEFNRWLEQTIENYERINNNTQNAVVERVVTEDGGIVELKKYLRETASGTEYYSYISEANAREAWENSSTFSQILQRLFINFKNAPAEVIEDLFDIVLTLGSILPGPIGEWSAASIQNDYSAKLLEIDLDETGANHFSDPFVEGYKDYIDIAGKTAGVLLIDILVFRACGAITVPYLTAKFGLTVSTAETIMKILYMFAKTSGENVEKYYNNDDIEVDIKNLEDRRKAAGISVTVAAATTLVDIIVDVGAEKISIPHHEFLENLAKWSSYVMGATTNSVIHASYFETDMTSEEFKNEFLKKEAEYAIYDVSYRVGDKLVEISYKGVIIGIIHIID